MHTARIAAHPLTAEDPGCQWWNLACHGGTQIVDSGLSAITRATASGTNMLLGEIVKTVDESTQVPLADPAYRDIYYGFLGLAAPVIGVVLFVALILSAFRRDAATLGRAVVGVGVAGLGGALYVAMAQLLVALDNWLSHGIVRVTGGDLTDGITRMASGFERVAGIEGEIAANMLLLVLMLIMLLAGLMLWFVLVLRKIAILVVVAFAPLLIVGYLWAPTRSWVRKATEVLVALVFTKSAIYGLFGIGLALMARGGGQSLSDFVGTTILLCGACFTPLLMLKLVHFAADSHLAGDMMGTLRGGVQPVLNRMPHGHGHSAPGRSDMARQQGQAPRPAQPEPSQATSLKTDVAGAAGSGGGASGAASAGGTGAGATGGAAAAKSGAAAGPVGMAAGGLMAAGQQAVSTAKKAGSKAADMSQDFSASPSTPADNRQDPAMPGPSQDRPESPDKSGEST